MTGSGSPAAASRQRPWVGRVTDDHTGGTDVAIAFRRVGLRTLLQFGEPRADATLSDCDAVGDQQAALGPAGLATAALPSKRSVS